MKIREVIEKHKFLVCVILLSLFVLISGVSLLYRIVAAKALVWYLLVLMILGVISIPVFAFIVRKKKLSVQMITVLILAVLGVLYTFVFTPNSVPDEPLHYTTAYHVSNQLLFKFDDEQKNMVMRAEDDAYVKSASMNLNKEQYEKVRRDNYLICKDNTEIRADQGYIKNKFLAYFASAVGITIGRIANLSAFWTYQLGRMFNFLSFLIFVYFAIKLMPFNKIAIAAIAMLPMNLHIMASVSYDVFSVGGVLLLFAYIMHLWYGLNKIGFKELGILAIMIALIIPQKAVYIGVAALVLLLPKDKFKNPKLHFLFKCLLGVIAVASILIIQMHNSAKLVTDNVTHNETVAGFSIQYVISHPNEIAKMFFYTICHETDFYIKSIVAYFGWFQVESPWFLTVPVIVVLLLSFMKKEGEPQNMPLLSKLYSLALFLAIFILVEMLLLIDHNHIGCVYIGGVQGRYFIPALPLVFLALRNNIVTLSKQADDVVLVLMPALNVLILIYCISSIIVV